VANTAVVWDMEKNEEKERVKVRSLPAEIGAISAPRQIHRTSALRAGLWYR